MQFIKNFFLLILSILFSLILIEIYLSFFMPQERNGSWRVQDESGSFFNRKFGSAKHEFIGKKDQISVIYNFGKHQNRVYEGFDENYNSKKILVLGDSNIFGWLLEDKQTFIYQLQNKFNQYYFVNASAGGWSDVDMYNYLKKNCSKIKPTFIIFFLEIDRTIGTKAVYLNKKDDLKFKKVPINNLKKYLNDKFIYKFLSENSHLFQIIKTLYVNISNENYINFVKENNPKKLKIKNKVENKNNDLETKLNLFLKLIDMIETESKKCGTKIIYVDRGWYDKNKNSKIKNLVLKKFNDLSIAKELNFLSLYAEMSKIRDNMQLYLLEEGHPNEIANKYKFKILSKKIGNYIEQ
jgi:hypothetical protein